MLYRIILITFESLTAFYLMFFLLAKLTGEQNNIQSEYIVPILCGFCIILSIEIDKKKDYKI